MNWDSQGQAIHRHRCEMHSKSDTTDDLFGIDDSLLEAETRLFDLKNKEEKFAESLRVIKLGLRLLSLNN